MERRQRKNRSENGRETTRIGETESLDPGCIMSGVPSSLLFGGRSERLGLLRRRYYMIGMDLDYALFLQGGKTHEVKRDFFFKRRKALF